MQAGNFQYQEPVKKCMSYCSSVVYMLVVFSVSLDFSEYISAVLF